MATSAGLRPVAHTDIPTLAGDPVDEVTRQQALDIITTVRAEGEAGLLKIGVKFGDIKEGEPYVLRRPDLEKAFNDIPEDQQALLRRVADRIRAFATAQRASVSDVSVPVPGGSAGHSVAPVDSAGCYAPGGRYPLPSSVLMTAITARVAGVKTVWVASPRPAPITIAAAYVADADALLCVGGAQAIAAMAYGVGDVPACDCIVGPGNRWVTAAKSLVTGRCSIDMLAGPSECLVLADASADPAVIAADLLAQSEHDVDAVPILVTTDAELVPAVNAELERQLETLTTAETARVAVSKGFSVVAPDLDTAITVTDSIGPEHLEVMTADATTVGKRLNHYGGLFVGTRSAEVFGDYGAGPNHVLPTSGTARYTGGLSVFTFLRIRTWLALDSSETDGASDGMEALIADSAALARLEGLEGHARAAEQRRAAAKK